MSVPHNNQAPRFSLTLGKRFSSRGRGLQLFKVGPYIPTITEPLASPCLALHRSYIGQTPVAEFALSLELRVQGLVLSMALSDWLFVGNQGMYCTGAIQGSCFLVPH